MQPFFAWFRDIRPVYLGALVTLSGCSRDATGGLPSRPPASTSAQNDAPTSTGAAARSTPTSSPRGGFAVIELFTSEGCSSCPPADDVLREIAEDARSRGLRVYPLAFHVDYWDNLGWIDPFSSRDATDRQSVYAQFAGERGVYTPQMWINGRDGFVGSDRARAHRGIDKALAGKPLDSPARDQAQDLTIRLADSPNNGVSVAFAWKGVVKPELRLVLAQVDREVTVHVPAGENAGRTLRHANVVRAFQSVSLASGPTGSVTLQAPATSKSALIAYVQDTSTLAIVAATEVDM